jgi:CYTH domain-containing protein
MEPLGAGETIFKLGKKEVPEPPDFGRMAITTIYLTEAEHELLAVLPAFELRKRRLSVEHGGRSFGVDVFEGALSGLVLAETELETPIDLGQPLDLPDWVVREVTRDERFTGGALAGLSDGERRALVRDVSSS